MKVAIIQEVVKGGGRLMVLIEIIQLLNQRGIVPIIITFNMSIDKEQIFQKYGYQIDFQVNKIKFNLFKKFPEVNTLWFNFLTRFYVQNIDLVINSNNTSCFLPKKPLRIDYVHFPRKVRVQNREFLRLNGQSPIRLKTRIARNIDYLLSHLMYFLDRMDPNFLIIANSDFTRRQIKDAYSLKDKNIEVIYPPVNFTKKSIDKPQNNIVATLGRFSPTKNQLDQLRIAKRLSNFRFYIIGFAGASEEYYRKCLSYIDKNHIQNVEIFTNLNYEEVRSKLSEAKYFLHTTYNEPFGITTVEGIASGCIPVVPNSGGQVEIVNKDELRFDTVDQAVDIFKNLENIQTSYSIKQLYEHINIFHVQEFRKRFGTILDTSAFDNSYPGYKK